MKETAEEVNPFAHPLTFVLTHIVFPFFTIGSLGYIYWLTVEALDEPLGTQMLVALGAAVAFPVAATFRLLVGPKRIGVGAQLAFAFLLVVFAYFSYPLIGKAVGKVDSWIIGPTAFLSYFIGVVPPIFAGVARLATANWKMGLGEDIALSAGLVVCGPLGVYGIVHVLNSIQRRGKVDFAHLMAVGMVVGLLVLFIGLCRLLHLIGNRLGKLNADAKRIAGALIFGLILPWLGLALNQRIPFPADFSNPWPGILSGVTTVAMLLPTKPTRAGLALWFMKLSMAPFVLYFFLLFVPFLPLAILAILAMGMGFLILAPTLLFWHYTAVVYNSWKVLRGTYSKGRLLVLAVLGFLVIPTGFVVDVEIERAGLKALVKWHTEEDFDAPPAPLPVSQRQAERIVKNANDFAEGTEIPFLSAWRTFRVYDGLYMADALQKELNQRILHKTLTKEQKDWNRSRNFFAAGLFGANEGRRRNRNDRRISRPPVTKYFTATCDPKGRGQYLLKVHAQSCSRDLEFIAPFRLPAGVWIEGMRLKMDDGTWKAARASERKAAEFVYRHITEQRRDPSIITLDTPTSGTLKIFPVGQQGRDVEITLRTAAPCGPLDEPIWIGGKVVGVTSQVWSGLCSELVTAKGAAVTLLSAHWMNSHTNELFKVVQDREVKRFSLDDPTFKSDLRRFVRAQANALATNAFVRVPTFEFKRFVPERHVGKHTRVPATNEVFSVLTAQHVPESFLATLRREFPGLAAFGDRPVDGWYRLETEVGGKVAVPYRKGEGALVFAKVKGAKEDVSAWSDGAKLWARENEAFRKPALDVRKELLDGTRRTGVLTTQSAYLAVETSAQEKALKQKEMEALMGNKSFDFEEPSSGDAPGVLLLLGGFLAICVFGRPLSELMRRIKHI